MIYSQNFKYKKAITPQSIGTSEVAGLTFDTQGYDRATIIVEMDSAAPTNVITALLVYEGEATNAVSTAIATLTGGTSDGNFTLPTPSATAGDSGNTLVLDFPLIGRKRYLKVAASFTAARIVSATALLSKGQIPSSDATANAARVFLA